MKLGRITTLLAIGLVFGPAEAIGGPNVLLILVDDLKPTIGAFGDEIAVTPHIDRLAERGARFERAYCNQAVCAPSRVNLMTSMRSTTSGIYGFGRDLRDAHPEVVTLPQVFGRNGYTAESVGKVFHLGHGTYGDPDSWTSPPWKESPIDYALIESTGGELTREEALFQNMSWSESGKLPRGAAWERADLEDDVYADGRIATEAIRRLRAHGPNDPPFFLAVGFTKPHLPFNAPEKYWAMYDPAELPMPETVEWPAGAPDVALKKNRGEMGAYEPVPGGRDPLDEELARTLIHGYYASVSYADSQIGRVLDELDSLGLADDTIVVLWGDHGFHLGDHNFWTKHTNYEQANRIPIVFAGPGIAPSAPETFAETVDIMPTLIDLAGLPDASVTQPTDGVSLSTALYSPSMKVREFARHDYKKGQWIGRAVRTPRYRLVEWRHDGTERTQFELYDFEADPLETRNIATERADLVERLTPLAYAPAPTLTSPDRDRAPVPLFADPNFHGSCDPEVVWNQALGEWFIYYTARRALAPDGRTPAGTPIGVASSPDWREWTFRGYCAFDGRDDQPTASSTYWAPAVVAQGDQLHMFVTYKPQATGFWGGDGEGIRHYVAESSAPTEWRYIDTPIRGKDAIDAGIIKIDESWRMFYRDRPNARGMTSFVASSQDLRHWVRHGLAAGDIADEHVTGHHYHEAQFPFRWKNAYWLFTDPSGPGLAAFQSDDAATWHFVNDFMTDRGTHPTDSNAARHPSVAIVDGRAFAFYHCEPDRPEGPYSRVPIEKRKTFLQVTELVHVNGTLRAVRPESTRLPSAARLRHGPDRRD
ncbi:MAG: sulfatase-like hydrolase/transferase [Planctomycetota bacterium]